MPPEIKRLADNFLSNPVRVEASPPATAAETIMQRVASSGREPVDKRAVLRALIRGADNFKNAIIFCNRKRDVAVLHRSLQKHGFSVGALHGDMDQRARMATLDDFKKDRISLLVASDVAARGLDIPAVSHIFNFDVPAHSEDYVHRIGRTGRAGLTGTAITIATPLDRKHIASIERLLGKAIPSMDVPAAVEERARAFSKGRAEREEARNHRVNGDSEESERHGRRRERPRTRNRRGRDDSPDRGAPVPEAAPRSEARHERRSVEGEQARQHRERRPPAQREEPRRDQRPAEQGHQRSGRPRHERSRRDEGGPVVGMGDHMPDFLRRPVKIPSGD
jgi:superfamily II DNA/RNA helicase